jgi:hypothetical protein
MVPPSAVPASPSDSRSKSKVGKRSLRAVEDYVSLFRSYLLAGKFIYSFATKRSSLAPTTVTSYCSFVRKYLEAIHRGLAPRGSLVFLTYPKSQQHHNIYIYIYI